MFRWIEPTKHESSATSNATSLDRYRYPNRKAQCGPVTTPRSRFDTAMIYVSLFLSFVAVLMAVGFHIIFG